MKSYIVKWERNIPYTIKERKANWIGHILHRNCLLKHITEGKIQERIEVTYKTIHYSCICIQVGCHQFFL